ncbi:DUF2165 family protein [Oceanisphaera avium]|uniref:DUF2165 domain-containing protein n=1 Tax=Oceanisphaera avium TaxID=1903694 RepID=A0A1Y0CYZ2_9GAMM|nr:DUF2165 domain-containing protein [Oceanisphaera avium]ART80551.1 hypothetical protein CBP12_10705 [Oceanisphaera avium]
MIVRLSKTLMVAAIGLFAFLVAFGNITDYGSNFAFVHHVFLMDTIFPEASIKYRAIETEWVHHLGYVFIILLESLTSLLCLAGAWQLWSNRDQAARIYNRSKRLAVIGLTLGFLTWQVGFMSVGGEWFGMWMSSQWNGVPDAFRFFITILGVLIYLVQTDDELDA